VTGDTAPSGPRRIASVVTTNVTAIKQARPKAGNRLLHDLGALID